MNGLLKYLVGLMLGCLVPVALYSQSHPSDYLIRRANHEVIEKIREYSRTLDVTLNRKKNYYDFPSLFVGNEVLIMNDNLKDNSFSQFLSPDEYRNRFYTTFLEEHKVISIQVVPLELKQFVVTSDTSANVSAIVQKQITGFNFEGITLSDTFYLDFNLLVEYQGDSVTNVKIASIKPLQEYGQYLLIKAHDYKSNILPNATLNLTLRDGKISRFKTDDTGRILLRRVPADEIIGIRIDDPSVMYPNTINLESREVHDGVKANHFEGYVANLRFRRAKYYFQMDAGPYLSTLFIKPSLSEESIRNQFSFSTRLKIGTYLKHGNSGNWNFSAGIGFSRISTLATIGSLKYEYTAQDPYDVEYLRKTEIQDLQERNTLQYLDVPVTVGREMYIGSSKFSVQFQAGAEAKLLLNSNYSSSAQTSYAGYYGPYYGITIAENGVYDFGQYDSNQEGQLKANPFLLCGQVGVDVQRTFKNRYQLMAGLQLTQNLNRLYNRTEETLSTTHTELRSVTELNDQIHFTGIQAKLGFKVKI